MKSFGKWQKKMYGGETGEGRAEDEGLHVRKLVGLLRFTRSMKKQYAWMFSLILVQMVTYQALAYSLKYLINDLIPLGRVSYLGLFLLSWVALFAIHGVFTLLTARFRIEIVQTLVARIRAEIIRKLQILSIKYFDTRGTGATSAKLLMDVERTHHFFDWMMVAFLQASLGVILLVPLLSTIDLPLTALTVLYVPAIPLVQRMFRNLLVKRSRKLRDTNAQLSEKLVDFISGLKQIRLAAGEDEQSRRMLREVDTVRDVGIKYQVSMRVFNMIIQFFGDFMPILLWVVAGILMIRTPDLTMGEVVAYIALVHQMLGQVRILFSSFDQVVAASPSVAAISEILESREIENQHPTVTDFRIDGSICARGVNFSYETRSGARQLSDVNVCINAGERIAFVGESGSGKSTFVNVLLGLYPIESGVVRYGPHNLADMKLQTLRSQIAIMSQDTFLFNTSIVENIRFADLRATDRRIEEALAKAEILDFVESLPEGLHTQVGERGVMLSGGQRQRLGMARVFLRDPRIVILDEPSSSLDVLTEERLFDTLYRNIGDRTLVVIAHRLSTIKSAERVFVFQDGRIVERGKFQDLLVAGGLFSRMVKANVGGEDVERSRFRAQEARGER
jgi:ATP-binding cassette subfamily B protein